MRTLSTQLTALMAASPGPTRVYADANVPAGLIAFMRQRLRWDVLFVIEHPELRRAPDVEHFRLARQMSRTLVTLDRDYLDDRRFPPASSGGVVVLSAPDERQLSRLLQRLARGILAHDPAVPLPLAGTKLDAHPEPVEPSRPSSRRRRRR